MAFVTMHKTTVVFWLDILMPIGQETLIQGIPLLAMYFRYTITQLAGAARSRTQWPNQQQKQSMWH